MRFCNDRDLINLEPNLFSEAPLVAHHRLTVSDGTLAGTMLTSANADFTAAQIDAGSVVLVDDMPHEVVERIDANTLTVSLLRSDLTDAPIPGTDGSDLELTVRTFSPQIALVHGMLMRLLGGDARQPTGALDDSAVVSTDVMRRLETLATLERIYSAAFTLQSDNAHALTKATEYRRRFRAACAASTVLIDLDGDGLPDVRRHLGVMRLRRG